MSALDPLPAFELSVINALSDAQIHALAVERMVPGERKLPGATTVPDFITEMSAEELWNLINLKLVYELGEIFHPVVNTIEVDDGNYRQNIPASFDLSLHIMTTPEEIQQAERELQAQRQDIQARKAELHRRTQVVPSSMGQEAKGNGESSAG